MGENSSGKWYTNPAIIEVIKVIGAVVVAIITGVFLVIAAFIGNKNAPAPPIHLPVPKTPDTIPDASENNAAKAENEESAAESKLEPIAVFQDDFEEGLGKWSVKRYPGYNNFMRWHISEKEHVSGRNSLALGHKDTDTKENTDTVHIETEEELFLSKETTLSFKLRKSYRINLQIVLKKNDAPFKETVIGFYPGNTPYKDWRAEEIPLGSEIDAGVYRLMLRAWDQGSLYLDDIKIQK
ncbi:MAG: hypothetical protein D3904_12530 [Candidatus Electrothrix sp. EH2]|nr:hypothetical protein [Candidatus Electrothrix sp. EH2]